MTIPASWAVVSSGPFGALWLEELLRLGATPLWVVCGAPKPSGRGLKMHPLPVEEVARKGNLPLFSSPRPEEEAQRLCSEHQGRDPGASLPQVLFVVDCGRVIREPLLSLPPRGCVNLHPSLLPDLRGAAPIPRSLLRGDQTTGTTLFLLVEAMDAGPVFAQQTLTVDPEDDAETLSKRLAALSARLAWDFLQNPAASPTPQDESKATQAPKILPHEPRLSWGRPACEIGWAIRAFSPRPGAWTLHRGKRLRILRATPLAPEELPVSLLPGQIHLAPKAPVVFCGSGALALLTVQPEGKAPMSAQDWIRGGRLREGEGFDEEGDSTT